MTVTLTRAEAIAILEEIARDDRNRAAQISALSKLEELRNAEDIDEPQGFEGLYAVKDRAQAS